MAPAPRTEAQGAIDTQQQSADSQASDREMDISLDVEAGCQDEAMLVHTGVSLSAEAEGQCLVWRRGLMGVRQDMKTDAWLLVHVCDPRVTDVTIHPLSLLALQAFSPHHVLSTTLNHIAPLFALLSCIHCLPVSSYRLSQT